MKIKKKKKEDSWETEEAKDESDYRHASETGFRW